uniref:Uncharacterized protein n=1 Tax=Opuntia streptacantha TaxID=393608 RepID=A0A7C9DAL8_OPUST
MKAADLAGEGANRGGASFPMPSTGDMKDESGGFFFATGADTSSFKSIFFNGGLPIWLIPFQLKSLSLPLQFPSFKTTLSSTNFSSTAVTPTSILSPSLNSSSFTATAE